MQALPSKLGGNGEPPEVPAAGCLAEPPTARPKKPGLCFRLGPQRPKGVTKGPINLDVGSVSISRARQALPTQRQRTGESFISDRRCGKDSK